MITREQYDEAVKQRDAATEIINQFGRQQMADFDVRLKSGVPFTDEELTYSQSTLCPCGHGVAYPKACSPWHYWDCSAILKGSADDKVTHTGKLPFSFYDIKVETDDGGSRTTRGVFRPKPTITTS